MGKQTSEVQDIGIFSDQSPRSKHREGHLQEEVYKINQYIVRLEGELVGLEADRSKMLRLVATGRGNELHPSRLEDCVRQIRDVRDNLEALKNERMKTEQEIAALHCTPEQAEARRALQVQFTDLAKKRLAKTKQAETLLQQFRQALSERIELAGKMRTAAEALDCEISGDVLDEGRFEDCLGALPDDLLPASERWQSALGLS